MATIFQLRSNDRSFEVRLQSGLKWFRVSFGWQVREPLDAGQVLMADTVLRPVCVDVLCLTTCSGRQEDYNERLKFFGGSCFKALSPPQPKVPLE